MGTWLPLLILLACPVMMLFMMKGMNGGHDNGSGTKPEPPTTATELDPRDKRLAALEREVAGLRAARDHTEGSRP
jgi:hypothetical protein